MIKGRETGK